MYLGSPAKSKKLRDSARGKDCTMRVPGVCNQDNETVVLCHIPNVKMGGTGTKNHDFFAFYGCSSCHDWFDDRDCPVPKPEKYEYALDALLETQSIMYLDGLLKIKGDKN